MEPHMIKEKKPVSTKMPGREKNLTDEVLDELIERYPHLKAARDAMRTEGVSCNEFSQDALGVFRQRFRV